MVNPISMALQHSAEEPCGAQEYPPIVEVPTLQRFHELRPELFDLLNRSHWDNDARFDIWAELDIKCIRMAVVCRQLGETEEEERKQ